MSPHRYLQSVALVLIITGCSPVGQTDSAGFSHGRKEVPFPYPSLFTANHRRSDDGTVTDVTPSHPCPLVFGIRFQDIEKRSHFPTIDHYRLRWFTA